MCIRTTPARVRVAMRTPPHVFPRKWLGLPLNYSAVLLDKLPNRVSDALGRLGQRMIYGNLERHGLPYPEQGIKTNVETKFQGPATDAGFVSALKDGRIEVLPTVMAFEGADVILADGERIQPEVVICATGYRRGLAPLVGHLGVLEQRGVPRDWPTVEVDGAPGLFFVGYYGKISGQLRQMRFEARRAARTAKRRLESVEEPRPEVGLGAGVSAGRS
jgi:putative flavoprotein involved in K+ transport